MCGKCATQIFRTIRWLIPGTCGMTSSSGGLTPDLGHADASTMLGKRESKDGKEELHR